MRRCCSGASTQIKLRDVGVRRVLENTGGRVVDRNRVPVRENELDRLPGLLQIENGRGRCIERDDVRAGGNRARDAQVTLHPVGLVRQIPIDVLGAVFLGEGVKQIERRVVVMRIARDHLAAEFPLEEIERRFRSILRFHLLRIVGI